MYRTFFCLTLAIALLAPSASEASSKVRLGSEYRATVNKDGVEFRLRLPEGWQKVDLDLDTDTSQPTVFFSKSGTRSVEDLKSVIRVVRVDDPGNVVWKLTEAAENGQDHVSLTSLAGRNGFQRELYRQGTYQKEIIFPVKDGVYSIMVYLSSDDVETYRDILLKSIQTLRVPDKNYSQKINLSRTDKATNKKISELRLDALDALIKSSLVYSRPQAEVYYGMYGTYEGVCSVTKEFSIGSSIASTSLSSKIFKRPVFSDSAAGAWNRAQCHDSATAYAAYAPLTRSTKKKPLGWCADSEGNLVKVTSPLKAGALTCEAK